MVGRMAQCESKVFFPDDPAQPPQFTDCPRQAETTRHTSTHAAQGVVTSTVTLCGKCAEDGGRTRHQSKGRWGQSESRVSASFAARCKHQLNEQVSVWSKKLERFEIA